MTCAIFFFLQHKCLLAIHSVAYKNKHFENRFSKICSSFQNKQLSFELHFLEKRMSFKMSTKNRSNFVTKKKNRVQKSVQGKIKVVKFHFNFNSFRGCNSFTQILNIILPNNSIYLISQEKTNGNLMGVMFVHVNRSKTICYSHV